MRLLLDTHVLLWAADAPERLGAAAARLADADAVLISAASVWELAIKQNLGKVDLGMQVHQWAERAIRELAATSLPVTAAHAAAVEHLPLLHRDPFDRMLVAQAAAEGVSLLTADRRLAQYGPMVDVVGDI